MKKVDKAQLLGEIEKAGGVPVAITGEHDAKKHHFGVFIEDEAQKEKIIDDVVKLKPKTFMVEKLHREKSSGE